MATKLFESDDRNAAHQFLAEHLTSNPESTAECREESGATPYQVWDGPLRDKVTAQTIADTLVASQDGSIERITVVIEGKKDIEAFEAWLASYKAQGE